MERLLRVYRLRTGSALLCLATMVVGLAAVPAPAAQAQTGSIVGTVVDRATSQPLEGSLVTVVGTRLGANTDGRGHFVIRGVRPGHDSVLVRRIGYAPLGRSAEVPMGDSVVVDFSLTVSAVELNQVVTTGTGGAVEKRELGAPISIVDASAVQDVKPSGDMTSLLEGQVSGLRSVSVGGGVGGAMDLRIRGVSSFTLDQRPVVYIDGVKVDTRANDWTASLGNQGCCNFNGGVSDDRLSDLNPADIDHVEILKGAAAATLYGSEASNGVIQIFTKRGQQESAPRWTFTGGAGFDRQRPNYPTKLYPNFTGPTGVRALDMNKTLIGNGPYGMYNIEVRGGAEQATYFVSGGYSDEVGSLQPNDQKRGNLRANVTWNSNKWQFDVRSAFDHNFIDALQSGNNWTSMTGNASNGDPRQATVLRPYGEAWVSVADIQRISSYVNANHWTGGLTINHQTTDHFQNRLTLGADVVGEQDVRFYPPDGNYQSAYIAKGEKDDDYRTNTTYTADYLGQVTFKLPFNIGSNLSFGGQGYYTTEWLSAAIGKFFAGPGVSTVSAASQTFGGEIYTHQVNLGGLVQDRFSFGDRLYTTVGLRIDGNSAFGHNYGFQKYPKIDAAFNLDGYSWLPKVFNSLKLRAALGKAGKAPGPYDSFLTLAPAAVFTNTPALVPQSPGNLNLKPEVTTEIDAGFDAGLFNDRLGVSASIFQSGTKDAILPIPLPPSSGFNSPQQQNVGGVDNRGWDLSINWIAIQSHSFEFDNDLKLDGSHNKITSIGTATPTTTLRVGYPVNGVWAIAPTSYNPTTKKWTASSAPVFFGPPLPTFNLSYSPTVRFGQLQAYVLVTMGRGAMFNNADRPYRFREHTGDEYLKLLGPGGADTPAADSTVAFWSQFTDIESRDNMELREVSLEWAVPQFLASKARLGQTTLTLSAHNVMWWDHCACQDPYTNWAGASSFGVSTAFLTDPAPRQFRLTIRSRY
ncbi:MAG: TonB-dependent receptor [Gemmatimonadota bacterium]|nr:TonB-dependent receptor [Gemmatimonadota bacterium]MDE3173093.1 TonB-dependent receptor [Gemmatimonadota bacterium]MDE3215635.1 TonB-dependent receptor [Gemmatimonadota bacterium]